MILGIDVWEGSLDINESTLVNNGVKYIVSRLNSISGGHHKDDNFDKQWDESAPFLRAPYFVYSPWATGSANAEWLLANTPKESTLVFADIEVKKDGYSPDEYAKQVELFCNITRTYKRLCIYTGGWFKSYLSYWPKGDYWWARYPYHLYPSTVTTTTWEVIRQRVEYVGWYPDPLKICPGTVKLWQCSADRYILPGTAGRVIDINAWSGTQNELEIWWGSEAPATPTIEQRIAVLEREALLHGWNLKL
jgi:hypothetical protein